MIVTSDPEQQILTFCKLLKFRIKQETCWCSVAAQRTLMKKLKYNEENLTSLAVFLRYPIGYVS